jgi:thioredoxin 1
MVSRSLGRYGYLGWVKALVEGHGRALATQAVASGKSGGAAFLGLEGAFQSFLGLPQARVLLSDPECAGRILSALLDNGLRSFNDPLALSAGAGVPLQAAPLQGALDQVITSAEAQAEALIGAGLLSAVQHQVATLSLLDESVGVVNQLDLPPDLRAYLTRRSVTQLRRYLADLDALGAPAETPTRLVSATSRLSIPPVNRILALSEETFHAQTANPTTPLLVHFVADWCTPCQAIVPLLEEMATEMKGQLVIGAIDVDQYPSVAGKYRVRAVPTLLLFQRGTVVGRNVGASSRDRLHEWLRSLLSLDVAI